MLSGKMKHLGLMPVLVYFMTSLVYIYIIIFIYILQVVLIFHYIFGMFNGWDVMEISETNLME